MFKIIVIVPLVALCLAAPHPTSDQNPTTESEPLLPRPSPINPDIPSDPKPEEKITLITDPQHKWQAEHGAINLDNNQREKPQKRQAEQGSQNVEECHDHKKDESAHVPLPITPVLEDQKEKGVKRDTTSTDISQHTSEDIIHIKNPYLQADQPHPCTNDGCQHSEDHLNHKRETRTTESPVNQNKPKTKPYVAVKPEPAAEKIKRENKKEDPIAKPQPEQPDEGDKKKDKISVPKMAIPAFLKPQAKDENPNSQNGSKQ